MEEATRELQTAVEGINEILEELQYMKDDLETSPPISLQSEARPHLHGIDDDCEMYKAGA